MLNEAQKVHVRRHLGYPVIGNPLVSPSGGHTLGSGFIGYRYFQAYGLLEYRLNWLQPIEEAILTGLTYGAVTISTPVLGRTFSAGLDVAITVQTGASYTASVTSEDGDDIYSIGVKLANAFLGHTEFVRDGFFSASPLTTGTFSEAAKPPSIVQPFPGVQITGQEEFTLTVSPNPPIYLTPHPGSGAFQSPRATIGDVEHRGFIPILDALQGAIASSSDNLDTEKADVWTARKDEVQVRNFLYNTWRRELSEFLAVPLWEEGGSGGRGIGVSHRTLIT